MKEIILHLAEVATNPTLADETPENGQVISEQLKLCMEINRSSAQLPDDVKLKIQRLTELLLQQSIYYNRADIWSKAAGGLARCFDRRRFFFALAAIDQTICVRES